MIEDSFNWLQKWIFSHFLGKGDDNQCFFLKTIDNPGWRMVISLQNTELKNKLFSQIKVERTKNDWIFCWIEDQKFNAASGPLNFMEMIQFFRGWADPNSQYPNPTNQYDKHLIWLSKWYYSQCNGDWEHVFGISINLIDQSSWYFKVELEETELENQIFQRLKINRSRDDWVDCYVEKNRFEGNGGLLNLVEVVAIFHNWAKNFKNEQVVCD